MELDLRWELDHIKKVFAEIDAAFGSNQTQYGRTHNLTIKPIDIDHTVHLFSKKSMLALHNEMLQLVCKNFRRLQLQAH